MATVRDLEAGGFSQSAVEGVRLNIAHHDPAGLGPFCRLKVYTAATAIPGVYAWVVEDEVRYVGRASFLFHVVNGARLGRAYNDYSYVPASKVANQPHSPRVRVNGLVNQALVNGLVVTWWWLGTESVEQSKELEARLIHAWGLPSWNRQLPTLI